MMDCNGLIPKKIKLIVNKGQDLQLYHPRKTIKHQPRKWRVLFLGVVEKMATAKVDSDTGNPEWLCEIIVTAKNTQDPISLLVTDSKGRHIGQVLIPLSQVPPPPAECSSGTRPPLVFSNIHKSELEPTKKNAYPKGFLYYWMWTDDYWKPEDIVKMKSKKSLSRSMHDLSNSTLNLFRRKPSTTSFQGSELLPNNILGRTNTDVNLRASPLKINNLKKKLKPGSDSSSSVNSQIMARSETMPNSPMFNGFHSKNPFDAMLTTDISIENNIKQEEPYNPGKSYYNEPSVSLHHQASIGSKDSPSSNKKKPGLFSKFKFKKSQSSADLTKITSEKDREGVFYPLPQSLGKQEGQRLFEKKNDFSKSSTDISGWFCGDNPIPDSNTRVTNNSSRRMNRPQSMLIRTAADQNPLNQFNKPLYNHYLEQDRPQTSNLTNGKISPNRIAELQILNKNREEMSKRELIDLATLLESQLKLTTDQCKSAEKQTDKLMTEKKDLQEDISIVKDELCRLKLRLLEAGDTKYLEKNESRTRAEVLSDLSQWRAKSKL